MDTDIHISQRRCKVRKTTHKQDRKITTEKRKERKLSNVNNCIVCPVCTVTVRGNLQFEQHYNQEVEKAKDPFQSIDSKKKQYKMRLRSQSRTEDEGADNEEVPPKLLDERTKDLKIIQKRKYSRYADMFQFSMKRTKVSSNIVTRGHETGNTVDASETPSSYELISCAVCNEFLEAGTSAEHLSKCFAKHNYQFELYSSDDESDEETVEEFTWAGQTWIRAASFMEDSSLGQEGRLTRLVMDDGDEELDIDGDTETQFGQQQFSEKDVIPCSSDFLPADIENNTNTENNNNNKNTTLPSEQEIVTPSISNVTPTTATEISKKDGHVENTENIIEEGDPSKLIESLKSKITKLEDRLYSEIYKCPICMGPYVEPVISINCWHTCCSECWLRVLGAKKMCPKCNEIVTPSQLRKIYL